MKGKELFVLTTDWIDDCSTIRQGVDAFESEEEAREGLKMFDDEVTAWAEINHPDWVREGDCITFIEHVKPENSYESHAVGKITKCIVK